MNSGITFDDDYIYVQLNSRDVKAVPLDGNASTTKDTNFLNPIFPLNLNGVASQYEVAVLNIDYTIPNNNTSGIFIYSDVCSMSRVGSTMANLLSRIPRPSGTTGPAGTSGHYDVRNLEWRPLNSTSINSITINMRFYDGSAVPSGNYSTFMTLAIRKKPS